MLQIDCCTSAQCKENSKKIPIINELQLQYKNLLIQRPNSNSFIFGTRYQMVIKRWKINWIDTFSMKFQNGQWFWLLEIKNSNSNVKNLIFNYFIFLNFWRIFRTYDPNLQLLQFYYRFLFLLWKHPDDLR